MKTIKLICTTCGKEFERSLARYNQKSKKYSKFYCSLDCQRSRRLPPNICSCCGKETYNAKYCSSSCAAKINNKIPKRKVQGSCCVCSSPISSTRKYCKSCYESQWKSYADCTLSQFKTSKGSRNSYTTLVRQHANRVAKENGKLKKCVVCGYDIYVECCHIKSVSSFSSDTKLSVVNSPSNLVMLCPNHHKEFDLGLLKL